jgi:hypothetical protein
MRRSRKDYLITQYEMLVVEPIEPQRKSSGFGRFIGLLFVLAIAVVVVGALSGGQASKKSASIPETARIDDAVRAMRELSSPSYKPADRRDMDRLIENAR